MRLSESRQKSIVSFLIALLGLISMLAAAGFARAQVNVVSDSSGVAGFRLQGNGITWWSTGACQAEIFNEGYVRYRQSLFTTGRTIERECVTNPTYGQVVRDGAYIYFVHDGELIRKPTIQGTGDPNIALDVSPQGPALLGELGTPLIVFEDHLYWTRYNATTTSITMLRIPTAGGPAEIVFTAFGARPIEMAATRYDAGSLDNLLGLVWLEANGALKVFRDSGFSSTISTLETGVADFDLHTVTQFALPGGLTRTVSVYAAVGNETPAIGDAAGRLEEIAIVDGSSTTLFTAAAQGQVVSVATDSDVPSTEDANVYISVGLVSCSPICGITDRTQWRRKISGSGITSWTQYLNTQGGANLASDDQFVYYVNPTGVVRIPTDAPSVQVDFSALGLEVVQNTQSLLQDVPLAAGKRTYVRGYPGLPTNVGQQTHFSISASLTGFRNGVPLPGSPLFSENNARVTLPQDFAVARGNMDRSFLWELPESWTTEGSITLEMTVDPNQSLPETEGLENNVFTSVLPAVFRPELESCLQVRPVDVAGAPLWSPVAGRAGFAAMEQRAATLLPITGLESRFSAVPIRDQVFEPEWNWVPCFPFICYAPILVSNSYPFSFPMDRSEDAPRGDTEAVEEVAWWELTTPDPDGCSDVHWVGAVHPDTNWAWAGRGAVGLNSLITEATFDINSPPLSQDSPSGGATLAHEIGHNHGRQHIDCGSPGSGIDMPPFDPCMIGDGNLLSPFSHFGFDVLRERPIAPTTSADMMSYGNPSWVSQWTYQNILDDLIALGATAFGFGSGSAASGPQLLIRGEIDEATLQAEIGMAYLLEEGQYDPGQADQSASDAFDAELTNDWRFVIVDGSDVELATVGVPIRGDTDDEGSTFAQYLSFPPTAAKIRLFSDTTLVTVLTPSANAPVLNLSPPVVDAVEQTLGLDWTASDADGDALHFVVWYSPDGVDWQTLRMDYPGLSATFPTELLPGGAGARVRITATDGFNTATVESAPFVVDDHDPLVVVSGIQDGGRFAFGERVELLGRGLDAEEGILSGSALDWQVSGPESSAGTGETLTLGRLLPGAYSVDLTGTDATNRTASASLAFEVDPLLVPESAAPTLDGICGDPAYEGATFVEIPLSGGGVVQARLVHSADDLYVCFSDVERGPLISSAPVSVGVRFEIDGGGDSTPEMGDRAFLVDDEGFAYQLEPDGGGANVFELSSTPSPDVYVEIDLNVGGWSAEFRIAEAAVGGWDHAARLQLNHIRSGVNTVSDTFPIGGDENSPATWIPAYFGDLPAPANRLPIADAGPDRLLDPTSLAEAWLDGTRSFDLDGDPLAYQWTQTAGPSISLYGGDAALSRVVVLPEDGDVTYSFDLVVNDGFGASLPDNMTIRVRPSQPTPITSAPGAMIPAFVQVGDTGNPPHPEYAVGDVSYVFEAGTTEVSNIAYVQFLNSVAASDPYALYSPSMETDPRGGIVRSGSSGNYTYSVKPHFSMETKPVNFVSWLDAARYVNWVENGSPNLPAGPGVTEDGSYNLGGSPFPMRTAGAKYVLPTEDEWVKAGFYLGAGAGNYATYSTQAETEPGAVAASPKGNTLNPSSSTVNYKGGAYWNGLTGQVVNVASTGSTSFYGTYDQGGNVGEWTESPASGGAGMPRRVRGGSFRDDLNAVSVAGGLSRPQASEQDDLGFRVFMTDGPGQPDLDTDGVPDFHDNCSAVPNAPLGGTCVFGDPGSLGMACTASLECGGAWGFCSLAQEDTDSNGIGLACDPVEVPEPRLPVSLFFGLSLLARLAWGRQGAAEEAA
ncbi:MAG: SUMF1/EgtB/PvdO family nonheme iron enzyme [Myxococcota bacterium]